MGRAHYLTIRCPLGCEAWLQPSALEGHLYPGRCRQHPWVEDLVDSAVVPAPLAGLVLSVLPAALVEDAEHPDVGRSRRNDVGFDFRFGRRIRSPLEGVRAKRWLLVATAVLEQHGLRAVQRTLTLDGFLELEQAVLTPGEQSECPDCGEFVRRRGLGWPSCHELSVPMAPGGGGSATVMVGRRARSFQHRWCATDLGRADKPRALEEASADSRVPAMDSRPVEARRGGYRGLALTGGRPDC